VEGTGRRIRQRPTRLAKPRVDAHIEVRPSSREIRLEEGRTRAVSLLGGGIARGDHVRPTTSRGPNSGRWGPGRSGGRAESGDKIKQRVERSEGRGRGGKGTFIVAKRRGGAMPDRAGKPEEATHRQRFYVLNSSVRVRVSRVS
jgi:hypothetical protein